MRSFAFNGSHPRRALLVPLLLVPLACEDSALRHIRRDPEAPPLAAPTPTAEPVAQAEPTPEPPAAVPPLPQPETPPTPPPAPPPLAAPQPAECPTPRVAQSPLQAKPLAILTLDASPSLPAAASAYRWQFVQTPTNSVAAIWEQRGPDPAHPQDGATADDPSTPTAELFVDAIGTYAIALSVTSADGVTAPDGACTAAASVIVEVVGTDDIVVQLSWHTPGDPDTSDGDGADVDLHFLHPKHPAALPPSSLTQLITYPRWNCFFDNCTDGGDLPDPDWGPAGAVGNPSLDLDDINGIGPEHVHLNAPENTATLGAPYRIVAHYYREESFFAAFDIGDYPPFGESQVSVRVYLGGRLAYENTVPHVLRETGDAWYVGDVHWTESGAWFVKAP